MTVNSTLDLIKHLPEILHDRVLRHWQDWQAACDSASLDPLAGSSLQQLGKVWACSEFVATRMIRNPALWFELLEQQALDTSYQLSDYNQLLSKLIPCEDIDDNQLMKQLRAFRHQQMMRIAWRDLMNLADTRETLRNLTDLAEVCVDQTLELIYQDQCKQLGVPTDRQGNAQRMVVLGMGKLGGYELNFSSDIDLIFCFPEEGEVQGGRSLANSQFFIRLGQRFIKLLNDVTADGFVFRVDMRLRPYGDSGPLVMSHGAMEQYYQTQGRDWERYAMIKARVIGGDRVEGQAIMDMLRPFVFRRYLDFGAFESIREMKAMIDTEIRRKGNLNNIKLGSGGIREIEFVGQTFQLIRGGGEPELQIRGIVDVLKLLAEKQYLQDSEAESLLKSYDFLRRLENRLQMFADAQIHLLPETEEQQASMALAMGYDDWARLLEDCNRHRQAVHQSFVQLLHETGENAKKAHSEGSFNDIWQLSEDAETIIEQLQKQGMAEADQVYHQLHQFKASSTLRGITATGRQRLDMLMPDLLRQLVEYSNTSQLLQRLLSLLQAILRRSVYLSLLNEYPNALKQLLALCAASPWIASLLSRYPVLLDELLDSRHLYQLKTREELAQELDQLLQQVSDDEEQQIERLRKFKQAQVLRIAAMDIHGVLEVFEVSDQLTQIAEVLLAKVKSLAWASMVAKHGKPVCIVDGESCYPDMGIVAYGKMGGQELSYGSDLDLVFLHNSRGERQQTEGERSLDNSSFFARMAQRIIHLLSVQTANGRLYEIDMRLRPDGNAGMLVSNLNAYEIYQRDKAWTWEHQALVRARIVCAETHLNSEFARIRRSILMQPRDKIALAKDVVEMRRKMRDALGSKAGASKFHLKQDQGGVVDIEFIAQFGVLSSASQQAVLTEHTATRQILRLLAETHVLSEDQASQLVHCYREYRICSHQLALQEKSSQLDGDSLGELRQQVSAIWFQVIEQAAQQDTATN